MGIDIQSDYITKYFVSQCVCNCQLRRRSIQLLRV